MKLLLIEQDRVQVTWPLVKDLLQKPLDLNLGEFNSEDILNWLLGGQMQLWVLVSEDFSGIMVAAVNIIQF